MSPAIPAAKKSTRVMVLDAGEMVAVTGMFVPSGNRDPGAGEVRVIVGGVGVITMGGEKSIMRFGAFGGSSRAPISLALNASISSSLTSNQPKLTLALSSHAWTSLLRVSVLGKV